MAPNNSTLASVGQLAAPNSLVDFNLHHRRMTGPTEYYDPVRLRQKASRMLHMPAVKPLFCSGFADWSEREQLHPCPIFGNQIGLQRLSCKTLNCPQDQ